MRVVLGYVEQNIASRPASRELIASGLVLMEEEKVLLMLSEMCGRVCRTLHLGFGVLMIPSTASFGRFTISSPPVGSLSFHRRYLSTVGQTNQFIQPRRRSSNSRICSDQVPIALASRALHPGWPRKATTFSAAEPTQVD